ncbi:LysR family transcriptional regulator [Streptomyces sp. NPDC058614]|uniref:LysR family transcriptional regulator n=1 Tax=Streptomyces sp. NPDC058614 TaxID=3346557 RepID=UPI00366132EE
MTSPFVGQVIMTSGVNLRKFDLNLLVALDALLHTRSVTKAGEQLNLTQSAVSAELRRLRRMFDDELLARVGRHYELTPLAQGLIEPVEDVVARVRRTIEHRVTFDPAVASRRFSLVMSDYTMLRIFQPALCRAATEAPGIGLEARQLNDLVPRILGQSGADLVIGAGLEMEGVHSQRLSTERFVCIVSADNPEVGDELPLALLESLPHLAIAWQPWMSALLAQKPGTGSLIRELSSFLGPRPAEARCAGRRMDVVADSLMLAPFLVQGTRLVGLVPERLAHRFRELADLKVFEPPFPMPELHETMYWSDLADTDPAHTWLRQMIADVAADGADAGSPLSPGLEADDLVLSAVGAL